MTKQLDEAELKRIALHVSVAVATSDEAKRRGEIEDFEIVVDSNGRVRAKVIRR